MSRIKQIKLCENSEIASRRHLPRIIRPTRRFSL